MYPGHTSITTLGSTLAHNIVRRAQLHGERTAVTFTAGDGAFTELTYAELVGRATAFAALIRSRRHADPGPQFVLIALPNSLEYVSCFYGCLIGGAVAVPFYPPGSLNARTAAAFHERLVQVINDCHPSVMVLPRYLETHVRAALSERGLAGGVELIVAEDLPDADPSAALDVSARPSDLALLQYTSGSTSRPKGVMVSHGNLVHNTNSICLKLRSDEDASVATWLPLFHDLGLIGAVCHTISAGMTVRLTTPAAFVRRPRLWLEMITKFRAVLVMAPNFAYDLCVRSVPPDRREGIDLSSLRFAVNAAEPVRVATMDAFTEAYQPYGFQHSAFSPSYGMAEATLCVTLWKRDHTLATQHVSVDALRLGRAVPPEPGEAATTLVGCGTDIASDSAVVIVDPSACVPCPDGVIGEIWTTGPSVAQGYWGMPERSATDLAAELPGDGRSFLRTGDLGMVVDGVLYVTGRIKDVIIQRGVNHYPQDLELTAEEAHPAVRPGGAAVFTVPGDDGEQVVLLCELSRYGDDDASSEILQAVRLAVSERHGLDVPHAAIVRKGQIPKTTSGKVRRRDSAQLWLANELKTVAIWPERPIAEPAGPSPAQRQAAEPAAVA